MFGSFVRFQFVQITTKIRVSVRVTVSEINCVEIVLENYGPGEGVEVEGAFSLDAVLEVADVLSVAGPTFFVAFGFDFRVH